MAINSITFLIFVAIVCILYFIMPKKIRWCVLLIASYIYYYIASGTLIVFLLITTLSIYLLALAMGKIDEQTKIKGKELEKEQRKQLKKKAQTKKKWLIVLAIVINFGILAVLKYGNFMGENLNSLLAGLKLQGQIPKFDFILPLGISYYTLQAISYVIDVYRGKYKPDKNIARVALFTSFFPQMVEGPIGRYDDLAHQLYEPHKFEYKNAKFGLQLILWGFIKKLIIADRAGLFVNEIFGTHTTGWVSLLAIILYTVQIYAEFSGCMDIVRGVAQIFGIQMAENFKRPFFSKSVQEFWRRWHITLGTWLKDYIFYPVSFSNICIKLTNAVKKVSKGYLAKLIPAAFAMFFVWFGNGIWHGASWKYVCYGLYYYTIMMLGMLAEPIFNNIIKKLKINVQAWWYKAIQIARTIGFVLIGMLIFRSQSLAAAWRMFCSIFQGSKGIDLSKIGMKPADFVVIGIGIIIILVVSILQEKGWNIREKISQKNIIVRWSIYYIAIFAVIILGIYGPGYSATSFIYGQF